MDAHSSNGITYYTFATLAGHREVVHGAFGRHGGLSRGRFGSLNGSLAVGDDPATVVANRRLMCEALGITYERLVWAKQVHSAEVFTLVGGPGSPDPEQWRALLPNCDGLITAVPDLFIMMTFGDCVPLLFYDPSHSAIGLAHGGWRGTVGGIAARTVESFVKSFGSNPGELMVGLGPSIGPCCYQIGEDVITAVMGSLPDPDAALIRQASGSVHFDLWEANRQLLVRAGVVEANIELAGLCTACNTDRFFSNRAERGNTGRFGVIVGLRREYG